MSARIPFSSSRARRCPALALACLAGFALGCGTDTTTLQSIGGADEAPEVGGPRLTPRPPEQGAPAEVATRKPAASTSAGSEPVAAAEPEPAGAAAGIPTPPPEPPSPADAVAREPPPAGVFGDWCARNGLQVDDAYNAAYDTADAYIQAVFADCAVSALTSGMSGSELLDWGLYVVDYAYLFTGCPLDPDQAPPEGGLSVFGPAHLDEIGRASPRLGRDDAQRLSTHFTDALVMMLGLTDSDRAAVELVLASSAERQIDPDRSGVLSRCSGDAADAGARDAGP